MLANKGANPFQLDSRAPSLALEKYLYNEGRYTMLVNTQPEAAATLLQEAQKDVQARWAIYQRMASTALETKS
jgi:pyruvate-ferredoxin/flavodoxin oxidoreductase